MTRALIALLFLAACGSDNGSDPAPRTGWTIGPIIDGKNYSPGMPTRMDDSFAFPRCSDPISTEGPSVHYVTRPADGPLSGSMSLTYRIEGDAELVPADGGDVPRIALYFQRRGDDWQATDGTEFYRWWSRERMVLSPGTHTLAVPLVREAWGAVFGGNPQAEFNAALAEPRVVGFSFGGSSAGHGVCALTGEATFKVRDFRIQDPASP